MREIIKRHKQKKYTYRHLALNILKYVLIFVVLMVILNLCGVDVTSIIAGLGIVSVVIGLALQDVLKDVFAGFNIVVDGYYAVGDVLEINEMSGKVIKIGLKSTKMKDIDTGNIYSVANRKIEEALILSTQFDISLMLPYELSVEKAENVILKIVDDAQKLENIKEVSYKGIQEFAESAVVYKIRAHAKPELQPQLTRNINRIIKTTLDEHKINIPYLQVDIHTK